MGDSVIKYHMIFLLTISIPAVSTNNRIMLGVFLAGSALAASLYGGYSFSDFELTLLTTAALILTFPRPQSESAVNTCTAPGYTDDPVLGCYRLYRPEGKITPDGAANHCASAGGRLLLINSEEEAKAFAKKIQEKSMIFAIVQGKRTDTVSPWKDDSGNPLPYLPTNINNANIEGHNALSLHNSDPVQYSALKNDERFNTEFVGVLCEI